MTSKPNTTTVSLQVLSQATRTSRFVKKLTASGAARLSLRGNLFKSTSDCSAKSDATDATEPECRVRFAKRIRVRRTLSLKDYTPAEVSAAWLNRDDYRSIRKECIETIAKMNEGAELNDEKYCARGLEGHTKTGSAAKAHKRALAITAVLNEQMDQLLVCWMV